MMLIMNKSCRPGRYDEVSDTRAQYQESYRRTSLTIMTLNHDGFRAEKEGEYNDIREEVGTETVCAGEL